MRALHCLAFAAFLAACGSDKTVDVSLPPTSTDVVGSFNLISANGVTPPFAAFATTTADWTLASDSVAIAANNTWTETTKYFVTTLADNTTTTQFTSVGGTYSIASGQIQFVMTQGGSTTFPGSVTGSSLTIIFNERRFIYARLGP
jgi:hypothetical protein